MDTVKKRINYLDIAKGIAIFLVILGHSCSRDVGSNILEVFISPWEKIIYSFHMPLFFVAAGIISHPQDEYSIKNLFATLKKNFYAILVPYFLFCLIYLPFSLSNFAKIAYGTMQTITMANPCCPHLWFLPCLFVSRMLMYRTLHFSTRAKNKTLFCFCAMVIAFTIGFMLPNLKIGYPFSLNIAFVALGFMLFGYIMSERMKELDGKSILFQLIIFAISGTILYLGNSYNKDPDFFVAMFSANYGSVFWFLVNAFAGIIAIRALSSIIAKISPSSGFAWIRNSIRWMGQNTIGIFLLHMPINLLYIMPWMARTFNLHYDKFGDCLLMTLAVLTVAIIGTIIINRVFPPLFGRKFDYQKS